MLEWALKYQSLGFSVIPLLPNGKEPLIKWQEFQKRKASENEIRQWFQKCPNANVGIVTGLISGVVVVDLDGPKGLEASKRLNLMSGLISISGNGRHLWYQCGNSYLRNSASRLAENVDIRGEGGYVVVPPSIHPNGKRYRFVNVLRLETLVPFPTKHLNALDVETSETKENLSYPEKPDSWMKDALEEMKNGHIHNTLVSVLGKFRYHNFSIGDTITLLKPYAYENGKPFERLEDKVKEIWGRYEPSGKLQEIKNINSFGTFTSRDSGFAKLTIHSSFRPESIAQFETQRKLDSENGQTTIKTGFKKLDAMLQNGLKSSRLFTIAARTGVGKTNWIIATAKVLCEEGKKVLIFSTEMPYEQIWQRYIATLDNPNSFGKHKLYVCDSFAPNLGNVEEAINEIKPDLFIFDHINHVSEEVKGLGEFMQGLNFLRRKYDCAGIVTAQLNRAADWIDLKTGEKVTPRMSMIKGSGTIEQASSRVLLLSETRVTPEMTEIVGNLDKNDNGTKGLLNFGLFQNPWRIEELI